MRRPAWVITIYVVLLLLAVATALPNFLPSTVRSALPAWATSQTVSLGLDLQGGAHLLLAVDRDDLAQSRLQDLRNTLATEMRVRNMDPTVIRAEGLALSVPDDA
jgi:SecD/SecF fusion protein